MHPPECGRPHRLRRPCAAQHPSPPFAGHARANVSAVRRPTKPRARTHTHKHTLALFINSLLINRGWQNTHTHTHSTHQHSCDTTQGSQMCVRKHILRAREALACPLRHPAHRARPPLPPCGSGGQSLAGARLSPAAALEFESQAARARAGLCARAAASER